MLTPKLPAYDYSLLIRTDFSSDSAWEQICCEVQEPQTENQFSASVECISDEVCAGQEPAAVKSLLPKDSNRPFIFMTTRTNSGNNPNRTNAIRI